MSLAGSQTPPAPGSCQCRGENEVPAHTRRAAGPCAEAGTRLRDCTEKESGEFFDADLGQWTASGRQLVRTDRKTRTYSLTLELPGSGMEKFAGNGEAARRKSEDEAVELCGLRTGEVVTS